MRNFICVYDFETDGRDPNECEPVQLASCMIHPSTLEIIENSEFSSFMRPDGIDKPEYWDDHRDTILWHAKNYVENFQDLTSDEQEEEGKKILQKWKDAPNQEHVFGEFREYLSKYHTSQKRQTMFTAPIAAGHNIRRFDHTIFLRKADKYKFLNKSGDMKIFHPRDTIDIMEIAFLWLESLQEPKAYNMDALREFFGMSTWGGHDALNDVKDEAAIIQRYMRLFRATAHKVQFKGSMKEAGK